MKMVLVKEKPLVFTEGFVKMCFSYAGGGHLLDNS